jgi:hypothetical protein
MKEKKVGIKFSLQKKNDFSIQSDINNTNTKQSKFPIYVQVTFDRKNTKFRLFDIEMSEDQFNSPTSHSIFEKNHNKIERIIRLENKEIPNDFVLKGIGNRLQLYDHDVVFGMVTVIMDYLSIRLIELEENNAIGSDNKGSFFVMGLSGISLISVFTEKKDKIQKIAQALFSIQQVGKTLLSEKEYDQLFTNEIREYLNSFINLNNSQTSEGNLFQIDILSFLEKQSVGSDNANIKIAKKLLLEYVYRE